MGENEDVRCQATTAPPPPAPQTVATISEAVNRRSGSQFLANSSLLSARRTRHAHQLVQFRPGVTPQSPGPCDDALHDGAEQLVELALGRDRAAAGGQDSVDQPGDLGVDSRGEPREARDDLPGRGE